MPIHQKEVVAEILKTIEFGDTVAEKDGILERARVKTSVFWDLLDDKVDLIPGTKGSGKSALFRMFTDFLPEHLLLAKRVAVAHGVYSHGDSVFQAFAEEFETLSEDQFVDFWCVYLTKIAYTNFINSEYHKPRLAGWKKEVAHFKACCLEAGIEEVEKPRSFLGLLESVFQTIRPYLPEVTYSPAENTWAIKLGDGSSRAPAERQKPMRLPVYIDKIKISLEDILTKTNLRLWLMVDRLDELFPRRSPVETRALRGLLRCVKEIGSKRIILKLFLRDDILSQVSKGGFTALTHVISRKADKLRWSEDQILTLIGKRLFVNERLCKYLKMSYPKHDDDTAACTLAFYSVFPQTISDRKTSQATLSWIFEHSKDGQDVVTPRDVIELLGKARQYQQDQCSKDPFGTMPHIIGEAALKYGFNELSRHKKDTLLQAEFPHLWSIMAKFEHGTAEYRHEHLIDLLGNEDMEHVEDLVSIGFLSKKVRGGTPVYTVPLVYRSCLSITRLRSPRRRPDTQ